MDSYRRDSGGMKQDQSTAQQLSEITAFCDQWGLILRHNFVDEAKSGGSTKSRDDFNRMIDTYAAADARPQGLILWNYARFSRDIDDSQLNKIKIRQWGITIHSLNDHVPEGDYSRVIEFFIDVANEEKRKQTSADAKRGLHELVHKYKCVPGTPPRGLKREPVRIGQRRDKTEHIAHKWVPDPAFKTRVKKAFVMRAQGSPLKLIHKQTQLFSAVNSYLTFFTNPIYKGELHYGGQVIKDYCKPMVPADIWDKVQLIINELAQKQKTRTSARHPRRQSGVYILSGISKCGLCHAPHYGLTSYQRNGSAYLRYACTRAQRRKDCKAKPIPARYFEENVLKEINDFFSVPENLINIIARFQEDNSTVQSRLDEELASLSAQLGPVRRAITNFTNAIGESGHSPALLKKLSAAEAQEKGLLEQIEKLKTQVIPPLIIPTLEQARAIGHKIQTDLQSKDRTFIRQVLLGILHEVLAVREKKEIHIQIIFYHTASKKKGTAKTASTPVPPVGAPLYRHSIFISGTISRPRAGKKRR